MNRAQIEAVLCLTRSGNSASPSCDIALDTSAGKETIPSTYAEIAIICGPQPGISPIRAAIATASAPAPLSLRSTSEIPENIMPNSKIRYAKTTQNVTNAVSEAAWTRVSSNEFSLSPIVASVSSRMKFFDEMYSITDSRVPVNPTQVIRPSRVNGSQARLGEYSGSCAYQIRRRTD